MDSSGMNVPEPTLPPGWPLLHLPAPAQRVVVAHLAAAERKALRLAGHAAAKLVDECIISLCFRKQHLGTHAPRLTSGRCPSVTYIELIWNAGDRTRASGDEVAQLLSFVDRLAAAGPWRSVRHLLLMDIPKEAALMLLAACPAAHELELFTDDDSSQGDMDDVVRHACQSLPLQALQMYQGSGLSDAALPCLARCTTLRQLQVGLGNVSAAGWAALLSMHKLERLALWASSSSAWDPQVSPVPKETVLDLSSMTAVTSLSLSLHTKDSLAATAANAAAAQPAAAAAARVAAAYAALRLPCSLVKLYLQQLPDRLPHLPLLIELAVRGSVVGSQQLACLAGSCPALSKVYVHELQLTEASHAAPLAALTQLTVDKACVVAEGVRLAKVFPALHTLRLTGECQISQLSTFFSGACALQELDAVAALQGLTGLSMNKDAFAELAQLPALQRLTVGAEPAHIEAVAALPHVTNIAWTFSRLFGAADVAGVASQFNSSNPPPNLKQLYFTFKVGPSTREQGHAKYVADAVVSWCGRAAKLQHVDWVVAACADGHADMTCDRLLVLAACYNMQSIRVQHCAYNCVPQRQPSQTLVDMAASLKGTGRLQVSINGMQHG